MSVVYMACSKLEFAYKWPISDLYCSEWNASLSLSESLSLPFFTAD